MATFTWIPSYTAEGETTARVREIGFGDGYKQRARDGINTMPTSWQLSFSNRESSEIDDIVAFLELHGGAEYFYWTPPRGALVLKYICKTWRRSAVAGNIDSLSATFEQVFDA